jgi:hypothetical protein
MIAFATIHAIGYLDALIAAVHYVDQAPVRDLKRRPRYLVDGHQPVRELA